MALPGGDIKEFRNDNVRVQWGDRGMLVQELPGKPVKRKVRQALFDFQPVYEADTYWPVNIMREVGKGAGATFDSVVKDIMESRQKLVAESPKAPEWLRKEVTQKPWTELISFLEVEPADYKPMSIKGKDFILTSEWTKFSAYSPDSDFQQSDPSYSALVQKSPGAARRLFTLLKADPTLLKNVDWNHLSDWLEKAKVGYDYRHSVWH
jgi:hypothetical protein